MTQQDARRQAPTFWTRRDATAFVIMFERAPVHTILRAMRRVAQVEM